MTGSNQAPASEEDSCSQGFNKVHEGVPTLIGNWVEERSLKEATGASRYETWIKPGNLDSIYATRFNASDMATHPRVIEHGEQIASQQWCTMYSASFKASNPAAQTVVYKQGNTLGPRAKLEMDLLKQEAVQSVLAQHEAPVIPLETTYSADFIPKDLTANKLGSRHMQDHDGRPKLPDPTFLAETQLVPRALGDRLFGETSLKAGAVATTVLANADIPITIYSEAVATKRFGGNIAGTRPIHGALPFNKFTNFSKPMSCYDKVPVDE